ncbi:serine hydrolase domain-containing protein [Roseivirga sp. BDSF3-8]|uniref:serine hydrolase domain-containing protein n=1 Tax=Roseivirga sp. BDSF3-8 TaxID=3241598 RepID=UPI0035319CBC
MKKLLLNLAVLLTLAACNGNAQSTGTATASSVEASAGHEAKTERLDTIVSSYVQHEGKNPIHSILVYTGDEDFTYKSAFGIKGRDETPVEADYQYNIASVTKPVVATVILQLYEEGKLDLDDKASKYLGDVEFLHFDSLHVMNGESMSDRITIDMLLTHTSGVADIFSDAAMRFNRSLLADPQQGFTPEKLAGIYYDYGLNRKPANAPGEGYHYSDINYNLLGLIIQEITGKTLPQAIRTRVLEPLGMDDTYFEYYEEAITDGRRTDAYYFDMNITENVNTSYEWGGGGLVSTTEDMVTYIKALMNGELFENESTLEKMLDTSLATSVGGDDYGRGIFQYKLPGKDGPRVLYGHSGFFGSDLAYDPENKVFIATHFNQSTPPFNTPDMIGRILDVVYE